MAVKVVNGEVVPLTEEEEAQLVVRAERADGNITGAKMTRDHALRKTDCILLEDFPIPTGTKEEWLAYRQELRVCLETFELASTFKHPKSPIIKKAGEDAYNAKIASGPTDEEKASMGGDEAWDSLTDEEKASETEKFALQYKEDAERAAGYPDCGLNPLR